MKDRREKLEEYINNIKDCPFYFHGIKCENIKELAQYMKNEYPNKMFNEIDIKIYNLDNTSKKTKKNILNLLEIYWYDSAIHPKKLEKNLA